jgi:hypothetical protein
LDGSVVKGRAALAEYAEVHAPFMRCRHVTVNRSTAVPQTTHHPPPLGSPTPVWQEHHASSTVARSTITPSREAIRLFSPG